MCHTGTCTLLFGLVGPCGVIISLPYSLYIPNTWDKHKTPKYIHCRSRRFLCVVVGGLRPVIKFNFHRRLIVNSISDCIEQNKNRNNKG